MRTLLVGSHFHPPAKALLLHLKEGTEVRFVAEPENPYDPNAILIVVDKTSVVESPELDQDLADYGSAMEFILDEPKLGHMAASGGKPLAKAQARLGFEDLVGNLELYGVEKGRLQFTGTELVLIEFEKP